jgi:hypothetical protein
VWVRQGGSVCGVLSIVNGSIWAEGQGGAAGIGTGAASSRLSEVSIANAIVTGSSSGYETGASGIGTGAVGEGENSGIDSLTIANANVTGSSSTGGSSGGSGIGTGFAKDGNSGIGALLLSGSLGLVCDLVHVSNILVSNAAIFTTNARVFATTPTVSGLLMILYGTATNAAQEPSLANIPSISIGSISNLPQGGWRCEVTQQAWSPYTYQHC